MNPQPAVFLDRDGTIIEDLHYPREADRVRLCVNAIPGLKLFQEKGYLLFVISNQSGVGRGIIQDHEFKAVHERCYALLQAENIQVAEFEYCFHLPADECKCRKPEIGLIPKSFGGVPLDWAKSFTVGDKACDLELGINIGATPYLVLTGKGEKSQETLAASGKLTSYRIAADLLAVAESIPALSSPLQG